MLPKNRFFWQSFISQARDDAILYHIGVLLTRHAYSNKTRITHFLKEKESNNGRRSQSTPHRDFFRRALEIPRQF